MGKICRPRRLLRIELAVTGPVVMLTDDNRIHSRKPMPQPFTAMCARHILALSQFAACPRHQTLLMIPSAQGVTAN